MTTATGEKPVVHRRPRGYGGPGRRYNFHAPTALWNAAKQSCQLRGISLGSQLVRALERIAAGETL